MTDEFYNRMKSIIVCTRKYCRALVKKSVFQRDVYVCLCKYSIVVVTQKYKRATVNATVVGSDGGGRNVLFNIFLPLL